MHSLKEKKYTEKNAHFGLWSIQVIFGLRGKVGEKAEWIQFHSLLLSFTHLQVVLRQAELRRRLRASSRVAQRA